MSTPSQIILDAAIAAYQAALAGKRVQFDGRIWEPHDIKALGDEVNRWRRIVSSELASASGKSSIQYSTASFNDG